MASRTLRISDGNFDSEGFEKFYGRKVSQFIGQNYFPKATAIDVAQADQQINGLSPLNVSVLSPEAEKAAHKAFNPSWGYLSLVGLLAPLHKSVLRNNAKNFIHPVFRRLAVPLALTTVAASSYNAYSRTIDAQYDDRTARYQAAANFTWQAVNNYVLPATLMRILGQPLKVQVAGADLGRLAAIGVKPEYAFKTSSARTYAAAGIAVVAAMAAGCFTKFKIEQYFVKSRFSRKDYGTHGHSYETSSLERDTPIDFLEQEWNYQGDEYVMHTKNEKLIAEVFPYFSLAEALPTHEVPYYSISYQNHTPIAYQGALAQGTLDLTVKQGQVPVPSTSSWKRDTDEFGEWSIATAHQLAADKQLLQHPLGRQAFLGVLSASVKAAIAPAEVKKIRDALEKKFMEEVYIAKDVNRGILSRATADLDAVYRQSKNGLVEETLQSGTDDVMQKAQKEFELSQEQILKRAL